MRLIEVIEDKKENMLYLVMDYMSKGALMSQVFWKLSSSKIKPLVNSQNYLHSTVECFTPEVARHYFRQLVQAVHYRRLSSPVHTCCDIVHKDIKPDNILVDHLDNLRLADFGISELIEGTGELKQKNGTNYFRPPESFTESRVDATAVDIWGMGVTLYMMVHGFLPYRGRDFNAKLFSEE